MSRRVPRQQGMGLGASRGSWSHMERLERLAGGGAERVSVRLTEGADRWEASFLVLRTVSERLRGLLGSSEDAAPVVIMGCSSIHTIGMRYPIDVAFADGEGRVIAARRGMRPGGVFSCRGACCAFERPSRPGRWMRAGDVLETRVDRGYETREKECA